MLTRTMILAAALVLGASFSASAKSFHHRHHGYHAHGALVSHSVSLRRQSGAPASVSPMGGDRAPITGGGY
jgi:hypothetical protein